MGKCLKILGFINRTVTVVTVTCGALSGATPALAEATRVSSAFFEADSAKTVFAREVSGIEQPELEYFPVAPRSLDEYRIKDEPKEAGSLNNPEKIEEDTSKTKQSEKIQESQEKSLSDLINPKEAEKDPIKAELLGKYGDPAKDAPLQAIKDAPTPFKAMMEAMESKREDLAFQYAKQYVRHLKNLQQRSNQVLGLTGLAMEREGLLEANGWQNDPQFQVDRKLLEDDLARAAEVAVQQELSLDDRAKSLLAQARAAESSQDSQSFGFKNGEVKSGNKIADKAAPAFDERLERQKVRLTLRSSIPRDPAGKVEVYFFFRPRDSRAIEMAPEINKLVSAYSKDPNVNVVGMSAEVISPSEERVFRARTKLQFPIANGKKLREVLKINSYPATVLVSPTTGNAHIESGVRKFYYLDEAVKLMEGK